MEVSAPSIDYVVAPGAPAAAIRTLTAFSGRQPVPPRWALGPMLERLVKNVGQTAQDYQANLSADLSDIVRYRLPLSAYRIEGWGLPSAGDGGLELHPFTAPEQAGVIAALRRRHIHPLVYLRPWITPGSAPVQQGLVARHADGTPTARPTTRRARPGARSRCWISPTAPQSAFGSGRWPRRSTLGRTASWRTSARRSCSTCTSPTAETGVTMHNRYLTLYARATRQEFTRYERAHPVRRLWFFDRAGYSGLPGTAAYDGARFPAG